MPEYFATQLRDGTAQVTEFLALASAADVRGQGERRARRRRIEAVAATMSAVLLIGGVAFGVAGQNNPQTIRPSVAHGATGTSTAKAAAEATATSSAVTGGSVDVHLTPPAQYAATTANKVRLTIDNPGPARQVVVEFKSTQTKALYWVEACDSSAGGGCNKMSLAENPLKVSKSALSNEPGVAAFDLALPSGTSTYNAWVNLQSGMTSYAVYVLDGASTVLGQTSSGTIAHSFPTLSVVGDSTVTVTRGGSAVEFDTKLTNSTSASYVDMFSYTTLSCKAGQSTVTVPQTAYELQWYSGAEWSTVGPIKALGQFSYQISAGETTTVRFRLAVKTSLPSDVTSCQVTQLVTPTNTWTPPYYDASAPHAQTTVDIDVR